MIESIGHWTWGSVGLIRNTCLDTFRSCFYDDLPEISLEENSGSCGDKMWARESRNNKYVGELLNNCNSRCSAENILLSMLLTDGHVYQGRQVEIVYKGINRELHLIFASLGYKCCGVSPNTFFRGYNENGTILYRTIFRNKELLRNLKKKSPDFRTSPRKFTKEEFLRKYSPTLKSCFSESKKNKKAILQLAMAAEGYVCPTFDRNFRITVGFSCCHPTLLEEWSSLFKEFDINMITKRERKSWSGVSGLYISDIREVKKFYEKLGFTPKIEITHTQTPWKNCTKQRILEKAIKYHEFLSYKYKISGNSIKEFKSNWKKNFKDFIDNKIPFSRNEQREFDRILLALAKIENRISPSIFIKVIEHLKNNKELNNETFREITGLSGIYAWSRCRKALKSYFKNKITEQKDWRSYIIKLGGM